MRYFLAFLLCLAGAVTCASAQVVDTSVCDILSSPRSFDGKIVRIKGTAVAGFDEFFVKDSGCQEKGGVWLAYPEGSDAKAGPVAVLTLQLAKNNPATVQAPNRLPVQLDKNKDFKQFDSLLSAPYRGKGMCLGCVRNTVSATFVGRLDGTHKPGIERNSEGKIVSVNGFGNMNGYNARLVLQSVSDIVPREIDYQAAAKQERGASQVLPSTINRPDQIKRAAAAFGEPGEDNGVVVSFGGSNELRKGDGEKGESDSPDGLLLVCSFEGDRLKGEALGIAMTHLGTHIADIRQGKELGPADAEFAAWWASVLNAVSSGEKTFVLPGGFVAWSEQWPPSEREGLIAAAISEYLTSWRLTK